MPATPRGAAGSRLPALLLTMLCALLATPAIASAGEIRGAAFQDANRDGVRQAAEAAFGGHKIVLTDAAGYAITSTTTDAAGAYAFTGIADGDYWVVYDRSSWLSVRNDWAPSTTGSIKPQRRLTVAGTTNGDFGWRPITWSTDPYRPVSSYTAANGLAVKSYNDAVTALEVYTALTSSWIGVEAPTVTIRFAYGSSSMTNAVAQFSSGVYSNYHATVNLTYSSWLDGFDQTLVHEYGHAWAGYHAHITQQDPELTAYLEFRGLAGDPRVGTSYAWSADEMIAEDYRQLFGSPTAAARVQANRDIPSAADVPGLREFLRDTFTTPPAETEPEPAPAPPALDVSGLAVNPSTVKTSGTVSFTLSAPATVTVRIVDAKGATVRTLLQAAPRDGGSVSTVWDRLTDAGRKAGRGTYTARVEATASGSSVTREASFKVA